MNENAVGFFFHECLMKEYLRPYRYCEDRFHIHFFICSSHNDFHIFTVIDSEVMGSNPVQALFSLLCK